MTILKNKFFGLVVFVLLLTFLFGIKALNDKPRQIQQIDVITPTSYAVTGISFKI
jgi:hypothetical protein